MAGTILGGKKAGENYKHKYDDVSPYKEAGGFYKYIGSLGGKKGRTGGFYHMKETGQLEKIKEAGRKGGRISRRPVTAK